MFFVTGAESVYIWKREERGQQEHEGTGKHQEKVVRIHHDDQIPDKMEAS